MADQIKQILHIDKLIFAAEDSDKVILAASRFDGRKCRFVGEWRGPAVGSIVKATGNWEKHEKYKWQFVAEYIQVLSKDPVNDDSAYGECAVTYVKVLKEETGFASVWGTDLKDGHEVKLAGRLSKVRVGSKIGYLGVEEHSEEYGDRIKVSAWEYVSQVGPKPLKTASEFISRVKRLSVANKIVDVAWKDFHFQQDAFSFEDEHGVAHCVLFDGLEDTMNNEILKDYYLASLPPVTVAFDANAKGEVINQETMLQAIAFHHLVEHGHVRIPSFEVTPAQAGKAQKAFRPERDMTPYIEFLTQNQSSNYPVIPILEYNQGKKETSSLFTLGQGDSLSLVWENHNDQRSTFVFKCNEISYPELRQKVFDYVMSEAPNKRQVLHHEECSVLFGQKPICLSHNDLESWQRRVIEII